jgi:hypothetical protein
MGDPWMQPSLEVRRCKRGLQSLRRLQLTAYKSQEPGGRHADTPLTTGESGVPAPQGALLRGQAGSENAGAHHR